ncbi:MAG: RNA 2'-phosphotransferase [Spirochaetes bacterium]|nr:MAG: RNA 2'-phosphotransferase [Spirochaetota bacterium]
MDLNKISRKLSKILRHDPYPFTISDDGWISTQAIINYYNITLDDLIYIVETNDKKRFSLNDDNTLICANQGHSNGIAENKVFTQITDVETEFVLYHGTDDVIAELIKNDVMKTGKRQHVHWTPNIDLAKKRANQRSEWNKTKPVLITLKIKTYLNNKGKIFISDNNVYLTPEIKTLFLNFINL